MRNGVLEAKNINNAASSGLQMSGSTMDAIRSSAMNGELDALDAQHQGTMLAYQKQVEGSTATYNDIIQQQHYDDQSQLFSSQAANDKEQGNYEALGAILGGAGSMVSRLPAAGL